MSRNSNSEKHFGSIVQIFALRGHLTTTWTRRGGGGLAKSPRLSTQGGMSLDVHVDKNLKKMLRKIMANDYEKYIEDNQKLMLVFS